MNTNLVDHFLQVFIDPESRGSELCTRVLEYFPKEKIQFILPNEEASDLSKRDAFEIGKRTLLITPFKGAFFKRCPGSTQKNTLTCCNYHVINLGSQCNMNCSYCYLQSYLNSPITKIYSNFEKIEEELLESYQKFSLLPFRIGTGEIIDSLSLDEISLYSLRLIRLFSKLPNWTLEFKTKSNKVDQFLNVPHAQNIVVSWSINAKSVIENEEHGTASQLARLEAASKCVAKGFKIAFHIDPMIWFSDWKAQYADLVKLITNNFSSEQVQVISLGALRFQPQQKWMMRQRFGPSSLVNQAEMFQSTGGKYRYDQALRQEMFQSMIKQFENTGKLWPTFVCMETPETWIKTYNSYPMQKPELKDFFRPLPSII